MKQWPYFATEWFIALIFSALAIYVGHAQWQPTAEQSWLIPTLSVVSSLIISAVACVLLRTLLPMRMKLSLLVISVLLALFMHFGFSNGAYQLPFVQQNLESYLFAGLLLVTVFLGVVLIETHANCNYGWFTTLFNLLFGSTLGIGLSYFLLFASPQPSLLILILSLLSLSFSFLPNIDNAKNPIYWSLVGVSTFIILRFN